MQGRRAMSVSPYFSRRRCEITVEEMIKTEIRKVETEYPRYMRAQKRSLVRRRLQFLSRAARKAAESHESCYHGPGDNQPMDMEQPPEQQGANLAHPIEISSEHNPPSPMYTPRSPGQASNSADEDPDEDFDWSGNEN
ncbi:hypothetical protein CsSME_00031858 [Camellia sinensis var. sinensis]